MRCTDDREHLDSALESVRADVRGLEDRLAEVLRDHAAAADDAERVRAHWNAVLADVAVARVAQRSLLS